MSVLEWKGPAFEGDTRNVAYCGNAPIGAVFVNPRARYVRWRIWCSHLMHPSEGATRSEEAARREVESRFETFLQLADLQRPPKVRA